MPVSLTDKNISDTYTGLLHSQGAPLSSTGRVAMYDGSGQQSSISIGLTGEGITVTGEVSCNRVVAENVYSENITCNVGVVAPNAPKAWVLFAGTNGGIISQYNVESVNRTNSGNYIITFSTPLTSSDYVAIPSVQLNNYTPFMVCAHVKSNPAPTSASLGINTFKLNGTTMATENADFDRVSVVVYHL